MWLKNKIFEEDLKYINSVDFVNWSKIENKTVLVTGATGLIGYYFTSALLYRNLVFKSNIKIIALVRSIEKAKLMYKEQLKTNCRIAFVVGNVEKLPKIDEKIDYIVHGANPTASKFFIEHPVETIKILADGTMNLLELAKVNSVKGFLYLSSMEVYGAPLTEDLISETQGTTVDTMSVRSCYPEAKRLCESVCASYASEYGVPANVIRLAQTFGPGVPNDDNRVFAEFGKCLVNGEDIVLQTAGTSKRCYLYNVDAVTAILTVLLSDKKGEVYNAGNSKTYCSIIEMANMVAKEIGNDRISVRVRINDMQAQKFSPPHLLNLDGRKLENLGWKATIDLKGMYERMIMCY